jgi:hypothetical protein
VSATVGKISDSLCCTMQVFRLINKTEQVGCHGYICNPGYLGGGNRENRDSKPSHPMPGYGGVSLSLQLPKEEHIGDRDLGQHRHKATPYLKNNQCKMGGRVPGK